MNSIKSIMTTRIETLLELIYEANMLIDKAEKMGFTVHVSSGGIQKFEKDFSKGTDEMLSPCKLGVALGKVGDEISKLEKEGFEVRVSGRRPNGNDKLYVEGMNISINDRDYSQRYYTEERE